MDQNQNSQDLIQTANKNQQYDGSIIPSSTIQNQVTQRDLMTALPDDDQSEKQQGQQEALSPKFNNENKTVNSENNLISLTDKSAFENLQTKKSASNSFHKLSCEDNLANEILNTKKTEFTHQQNNTSFEKTEQTRQQFSPQQNNSNKKMTPQDLNTESYIKQSPINQREQTLPYKDREYYQNSRHKPSTTTIDYSTFSPIEYQRQQRVKNYQNITQQDRKYQNRSLSPIPYQQQTLNNSSFMQNQSYLYQQPQQQQLQQQQQQQQHQQQPQNLYPTFSQFNPQVQTQQFSQSFSQFQPQQQQQQHNSNAYVQAMKALQNKIKSLEQENISFKKQVQQDSEIRLQELQSVKDELANEKQKNQELQEEFENLQTVRLQEKEIFDELENKLKEKLMQAEKDFHDQENQFIEQQKINNQLQEQIQLKAQVSGNWAVEKQNLEEKFKDFEEQILRLNKVINSKSESIQKLEINIIHLEDSLEIQTQKYIQILKEKESDKIDFDLQMRRQQQKFDEISSLQQKSFQYEQKNSDSFRSRYDMAQYELDLLEKENQKIRNKSKDAQLENSKLKGKISVLEKENDYYKSFQDSGDSQILNKAGKAQLQPSNLNISSIPPQRDTSNIDLQTSTDQQLPFQNYNNNNTNNKNNTPYSSNGFKNLKETLNYHQLWEERQKQNRQLNNTQSYQNIPTNQSQTSIREDLQKIKSQEKFKLNNPPSSNRSSSRDSIIKQSSFFKNSRENSRSMNKSVQFNEPKRVRRSPLRTTNNNNSSNNSYSLNKKNTLDMVADELLDECNVQGKSRQQLKEIIQQNDNFNGKYDLNRLDTIETEKDLQLLEESSKSQKKQEYQKIIGGIIETEKDIIHLSSALDRIVQEIKKSADKDQFYANVLKKRQIEIATNINKKQDDLKILKRKELLFKH